MHIPIQNANNAMTDMERAENKGKYSDLLQFSLSILQCTVNMQYQIFWSALDWEVLIKT